MDLKKSEGGGITRLLPDGRLGSHYYGGLKKDPTATAANPASASLDSASASNLDSNRCFPHLMASVPQPQESFSDLLTSVLSPDEAANFEADLDGLNLDFPPLTSSNYTSSEVVAAAIMATSSDHPFVEDKPLEAAASPSRYIVQQRPSNHYNHHFNYGHINHEAVMHNDDNSSLCSSPSPPIMSAASPRPLPQPQQQQPNFYHYQGSFYGHHHHNFQQPLQPHVNYANKAATLHVVVTSPPTPAQQPPKHQQPPRSPSVAGDSKSLLLMRVSSVKSSNVANNNNNNNNNNKRTYKDQRTTTVGRSCGQDDIQGMSLEYPGQQPQGDLADQLLQQCLVPIVPNPRDLSGGGLWFRCRICHKVEMTSKLALHARTVHHTDHVADCITSSLDQQQLQNGGQTSVASEVSPPWCEGAFPSDLEDVTLSPASNMKTASGAVATASATASSTSGRNVFEATSSSCSPPSVTDLTPMNPQDHFDPDFDVVDDMKFIDSLIRTMPEDHQAEATSNNSFHKSNNTSSNGGLHDHHVIYPQPPTPSSSAAASTATISASSSVSSSSKLHPPPSSSAKKSSPQFRWRRRKRRSKAQYPEMSRYLLPIDDGEEVQHLGRTLECTLCGLRGKRCHLTLHFKAKHNEVIDLGGVSSSRKNNVGKKVVVASVQPPLNRDLCWQPPANVVGNGSKYVEAGSSTPISSPPPRPTSANQSGDQGHHLNSGHLSSSPASSEVANEKNQSCLVVKQEPAVVLPVRVQEPAKPTESTEELEMSTISPHSPIDEDSLLASDDEDASAIDAMYFRKYPNLRGGSMCRELTESEVDRLNLELGEAVASFHFKETLYS